MTEQLLIHQHLPAIYGTIIKNAIVKIISPTGTGKSLGIPFIIYQNGYRVFISVPTRTAAINLYKQQQKILNLYDHTVGYAAENNINYTDKSKIIYVTSGHLRRKMFAIAKKQKKAEQNFCDILMLDEIHTGTLDNTILLSLWYAWKKYTGLARPRLVVASASDIYLPFEKIININIEGKSFPVDVQYETGNTPGKNNDFVAQKIIYVHTNTTIEDGHILVFLATKKDIIDIDKILRESYNGDLKNAVILQAYGGLEDIQNIYQDFYDDKKKLKRKIILATNIAETSVTINNVGFVIDSMYENLASTSTSGGLKLTKTLISKDSAKQRMGRTGRTMSGICFRLISQKDYNNLTDSRPLEINRIPFYEILIEIIDAGIDPHDFILDETPMPEKKVTFIQIDNELQELIKQDLIIPSDDDGNDKIKMIVTEKGRFAAPLTFGLKNSLFLWAWRQKYTLDKLFPGLVIAALIDNFYPPYFYPQVNKNDKETDAEFQQREEKILKNKESLLTNDALLSNLQMYNQLSTLWINSDALKGKKITYDDKKLRTMCRNYNLNYLRIIELIKMINNNIKILKITNITTFAKSLDKIYSAAVDLLQDVYRDSVLNHKHKNEYSDSKNKNVYVLRANDVNTKTFSYPNKIIALSTIEANQKRFINLFAALPIIDKNKENDFVSDTVNKIMNNEVIFNYEVKKQDVEYTRYLYVKKMASLFKGEAKLSYEIADILERWLMSLANDLRTPETGEFLILSHLISSHPAYIKMAGEIKDLAKKYAQVPLDIASLWLKLAIEYATLKDYILCPPITIDSKKGLVQIGSLQKKIDIQRLKLLQRKVNIVKSNDIKGEEMGEEEGNIIIGCMILRYESLLPRGQHWAVPTEIYQILSDHGFTIEGFASPIDSRLLSINENVKFCSLFYDTDHYFGSVGPFDKYEFTSGQKVVANPPYVDSIMRTMYEHIKKFKNVTFYITVPAWDDADYIIALKKNAKIMRNLEKGKYYFINDNSNADNNIVKANFAGHIFITQILPGNILNDIMKIYQP